MNTDIHGTAAPTPTPKPKKAIPAKTLKVMNAITGGITRFFGPIIKDHATKISTLTARLSALESQVAVLDARPGGVIDKGVFVPGTTYDKSVGVSWDGGYWIAQQRTDHQPGDTSTHWRLAVRRGKQGREGRPCPNCRGAAS